jgi:hypothetical protein
VDRHTCDCGCWYSKAGTEIDYCPMHAAAPEMRDLVQEVAGLHDEEPAAYLLALRNRARVILTGIEGGSNG